MNIQDELDKLGAALVAKGFPNGKAEAWLSSYLDEPRTLCLSQKKPTDVLDVVVYWAKGATFADKVADAAAWIEKTPDPKTRARAEFASWLEKAIKDGVASGMPDDAMGPLWAALEALA